LWGPLPGGLIREPVDGSPSFTRATAAHLTSAPARLETTASDAIDRARADFDAGRYAQAARRLEPVTAADSLDAPAYFWLGRARLEERDYRSAAAALTRAVNLKPDDAEYRRWLARAHAELAERERSFTMARRVRQDLEQAVRLDPSNLAVRRDLMGFYLEAPWLLGGGDGKARTQIDAIAARDSVAGHLARAAYFRHKNDGARARAEYAAVLKAAPRTISPYLEAAEFYERSDDAAGLQQQIDAVQKIDPEEPQLRYFGGVHGVLTRTGLDTAERELLGYLDRVPPRSDRPPAAAVHEWLGRLEEARDRRDQAIAEYRKALALQPDRETARERLRRLEQRRP
jgi:tetratricopeptide (TPR) repeat protein